VANFNDPHKVKLVKLDVASRPTWSGSQTGTRAWSTQARTA